jgi:hypothetical protein
MKIFHYLAKGILVVFHEQALYVLGHEDFGACALDAFNHRFIEAASFSVNDPRPFPIDRDVLAREAANKHISFLGHRFKRGPYILVVDFPHVVPIGSTCGFIEFVCPNDVKRQALVLALKDFKVAEESEV